MTTTFPGQKQPPPDRALPGPRGLLPVPPEVAEHVEREAARAQAEHGFLLTEEARRRMRHQGTLDWFYRDRWVSYRETLQGVEVLAVGLEEVGELASRLTEEERAGVTTKLV
jgi:hypothetical protein